jgi:hypothetical protein
VRGLNSRSIASVFILIFPFSIAACGVMPTVYFKS